MAGNVAFATKLSAEVKRELDELCVRYGLRKNFVVEQALREKLERLRATFAFDEAQRTAGRFIPLAEVERELKRRQTI